MVMQKSLNMHFLKGDIAGPVFHRYPKCGYHIGRVSLPHARGKTKNFLKIFSSLP
jgi:hypothetical protein